MDLIKIALLLIVNAPILSMIYGTTIGHQKGWIGVRRIIRAYCVGMVSFWRRKPNQFNWFFSLTSYVFAFDLAVLIFQ